MKPQLALAVWAVCCPAHTLDKFKSTWASWLLGCWHSFFSTHGWLSHGDYFDSAAWRGGRVLGSQPNGPSFRAQQSGVEEPRCITSCNSTGCLDFARHDEADCADV